jgi:hypothetical protein
MKTTVEIPDQVFRRAKAKAAERGITLRQFITEAVEDKLKTSTAPGDKPWLRTAGKLCHLHRETVRINKLIAREFESVEPEEWHPATSPASRA